MNPDNHLVRWEEREFDCQRTGRGEVVCEPTVSGSLGVVPYDDRPNPGVRCSDRGPGQRGPTMSFRRDDRHKAGAHRTLHEPDKGGSGSVRTPMEKINTVDKIPQEQDKRHCSEKAR